MKALSFTFLRESVASRNRKIATLCLLASAGFRW